MNNDNNSNNYNDAYVLRKKRNKLLILEVRKIGNVRFVGNDILRL